MKPNNQETPLWDALREKIENEAEPLSAQAWTRTASHSLADRLAELLLNGFLPLMVIQIVLLSLAARSHSSLLFWGGILLSPLLALLFRPLASGEFGAPAWRLSVTSFCLVLVVPLTQFLPALALRLLPGDKWMPEGLDFLLARTVQAQLEGSLQGFRPLLILAVTLGLALLCHLVRAHFPWIEHRTHSNWKRLPAALCILVPLVWLFWLMRPVSEFQTWEAEIKPLYEQALLSRLPEDGPSRAWRELEEKLEELPSTKDEGWVQQNVPQEHLDLLRWLEREFLTRWASSPPDCRRELRAALQVQHRLSRYVSLLDDASGIILARLHPRFQGVREDFEPVGLEEWIRNPERTEAQLRRAKEQLTQALELLPDSLRDLDVAVYDDVYGRDLPLLLPTFHGVTPKGKFWGSRAALAHPDALKIGFWESDISPKNLLLEQKRRLYLRAWLETRGMFLDGLEPSERSGMKLEGQWTPELGATVYYQDRLFRRFKIDGEENLRAALLYLEGRLQ